MRKTLVALYSVVAYAFFLAVFVYIIGWVEGIGVPKTIDSGPNRPVWSSLLIDAALLTLFALQHSIMARPAFKRAWTKIVPAQAERSTFVLAASLLLALVCWQWQSAPALIWDVEDSIGATVLSLISWSGWGMVLLSTFLISHFHLFGLTQGFAALLRRVEPEQVFTTPLFYRYVRHPLYAGFLLAFWATPRMSVGHLFFAIATTGYILVGIWLEERDLVAHFGDRYREYRTSVGMLVPRFRSRASRDPLAH